jgi:MFS family permease
MNPTKITTTREKMVNTKKKMNPFLLLLPLWLVAIGTEAFTPGLSSTIPRVRASKSRSPERARVLALTTSSIIRKQQWKPLGQSTTSIVAEDESTARSLEEQDKKAIDKKEDEPFLRRIDGIVFLSYLCNVMALSLPVLLVPIAATEHAISMSLSAKATSIMVASQVASISSVASLGGALGKFVNGFICKEFGSYFCSTTYLAGLGLSSMAFSLTQNSNTMSMAFASMEFFASIQWASLAVMLSNYYAKQPVKLAAALTALGLSSTSGQLLAKFFGMTLSSAFHWRLVAQLGGLVAFGGAALISRAPGGAEDTIRQQQKPPFEWRSITQSLKAVLGSPLFWMLGLAHSMSFVCRGTDRILGTFFQQMASLPPAISGGLTITITFGLIQGLITGAKAYAKCATLQDKRNFLKKRYLACVGATLGLVGLSHFGAGLLPNRWAMTAALALVSGVMASNISFQYFQFPGMIAQAYGEHKAVVISFLDGFGFLLSAPIFATIGKLVPSMGWSSGWAMLASLFGAGAVLMMTCINPILKLSKTSAEEELEKQQRLESPALE